MAITVTGAGGYAWGTAPIIAPSIPPDSRPNDVLVCFVESDDPDVESMAGWLQPANSPVPWNRDEGTRLTVFWKRVTAEEIALPYPDLTRISSPGNHHSARIIGFRGVKLVGDPWEATNSNVGEGDQPSNGSGFTINGVTTLTANCAIVYGISGADDGGSFESWSNPSLTGFLERFDNTHNEGNGGTVAAAVGFLAAAGPTGNARGTCANDEEWAGWCGALTAEPGEDLPPDPGPGNQERFVYPVGIVSPIGNLIVQLIRIDRELPYGTIAFDTWQWDTPEPVIEDRDRIDYYLAWQMMDNTMESQPKKIDAIRLTAKGNNPTVQIFAASPGDEISKEDLEDGTNSRASVRFEDSEEITRYERKKVKIKNLSIWTARYSGSWDGENEKDRLDELIIEGDIHGTTK